MTAPEQPHLAAMMMAAELEWRANAPEDWTAIDFWRWPRGFHRSAWVVAGYIAWNPLDALDKVTPVARAVNALLTRLCVTFTVVMTRHTPDPRDPEEPLLAWFNAAAREHQHDIAEMIEGLGDAIVKASERAGVSEHERLNRNLHLGHGQDCAGEAELGDLAGETIGLHFGRGAAEVVGAEVLVEGAVTEHVVGGGQDRGCDSADRLLGSTPVTQALELGLQVAAIIHGSEAGHV